jgi:hypothetical protein
MLVLLMVVMEDLQLHLDLLLLVVAVVVMAITDHNQTKVDQVVHLVVVDGQVVVKVRHREIHILEHLLILHPTMDGVDKADNVQEPLVTTTVEAAVVPVRMDRME